MDVVLTPTGSQKDTWSLKDRLGRSLGSIRQADGFQIMAEPESKLHGIGIAHTTLDSAMTAIASRMGGVCSLDSQDWDKS